ncbi:PREDICTED: uncharacterized protein LOC105461829 [Wasmannia auropunctata]|uniref:uncharacterized protein LOC105461829 n=1 Tax=Wasmannia auropunctata TaxID=64793 RepID=UPI0005F0AF41|nr:PREDICTED: uncharacterized protein LOC105461829 [Wasmannia auropunctata]
MVKDFYFNGNVTLGFGHNLTEMLTDAIIAWPQFLVAQYQSKLGKSSIYFSVFAYEGTFSSTFGSDPNRYTSSDFRLKSLCNLHKCVKLSSTHFICPKWSTQIVVLI